MRNKLVLLLILVGCQRDSLTEVSDEMESILGEKVQCLQVFPREGYLCKGMSGRNYYCPRNSKDSCFFTNRLQLLDIPAEKPK